jgi:hypothetical protein
LSPMRPVACWEITRSMPWGALRAAFANGSHGPLDLGPQPQPAIGSLPLSGSSYLHRPKIDPMANGPQRRLIAAAPRGKGGQAIDLAAEFHGCPWSKAAVLNAIHTGVHAGIVAEADLKGKQWPAKSHRRRQPGRPERPSLGCELGGLGHLEHFCRCSLGQCGP